MKLNIQLNEKQKKILFWSLISAGAAAVLTGFIILLCVLLAPKTPPTPPTPPSPYPDTYPEVCQDGKP